ncbi:MAG: TIM-barrel domain-containing protein [Sphingomonas sp.]|jgi:alpha-D-xyloside xylohydrolase|uniref:glycoside hydrolase family 31 protein n=1 Tax=Sphingomonas sp. TaxID=28214 RepID=UPI0035696BE0
MSALRWLVLGSTTIAAVGTMAALASGVAVAAPQAEGSVARIGHGVVVTPASGAARRVRVLAYGDATFRVTAVPESSFDYVPDSLMVIARPDGNPVIANAHGYVSLTLPRARARVRLSDGSVSFFDAAGKPLLTEAPRTPFRPIAIEGKPYFSLSQQFNRGTDEGFYGLGQHQNRQMNYNGEDVELAQHNMDIAIPFVVSTRGYGLLWDNDGITRFGNPRPYALVGDDLKVTSAGKPGWQADYYLGAKLAVSRQEKTINYQFIRDQKNWPAAGKATVRPSGESGQNTAGVNVQKQKVVWTGNVTADRTGMHKFRLYASSYMKVYADGKLVLSHWRQNWNPWFHNFDLQMAAGKPVAIRVEWEPNAGYIALVHNDPMPMADRHSLWMTSDVGKDIDYYFVGGGSIDGAIAGYRALTGKASLIPKWAYGFWQSRQRYNSATELLDVVREYRKRAIPLDNIVLDWRYWVDDQWGSHDFDPSRFPDPRKMVDDVHALGARIMISVWAKFYPNTANGKALNDAGFLYRRPLEAGQKDWVGPGYANTFYDPYTKAARDRYFDQINDKLVSKGFDGWWLDSDEPDWHSNLSIEERSFQMGPTVRGPGAAVFNTYPLVHVEGVADNLRRVQAGRRPFILTRSAFGGIQRSSAAVWSGDVAARWDNLRDQISAGVNLSMSGVPNWSQDIGGFAVEDRYTQQRLADQPEWRELNLRWFQFGAFSPLFRSHGEFPYREIYEISAKDPAMQASMIWYDKLRYRLMPYIYTTAADTWFADGSIMRGLVMDFGADRRTWGIDDEYMFGPSLLVAPVSEFKARSRRVYLPAGAGWYDFNRGTYYPGGQSILAAAPYGRMPLFVRSGAILPTGPDVQTTAERPGGPIVLHVFAGADGRYSLYEDDGVSDGYAKGKYARIPVRWDDKAGSLTIGARSGSYEGMATKRSISIRFYSPKSASAPDFSPNAARTLVYDGRTITIRR